MSPQILPNLTDEQVLGPLPPPTNPGTPPRKPTLGRRILLWTVVIVLLLSFTGGILLLGGLGS